MRLRASSICFKGTPILELGSRGWPVGTGAGTIVGGEGSVVGVACIGFEEEFVWLVIRQVVCN